MQETFIGVDVAKDWLDIFHPGSGASRIANTPVAVRRLARDAVLEGTRVIFEASGGYDRALARGLETAGVFFSRVNPQRARDFARAMGIAAKTDRVDARMLAQMGQRLDLPQTRPISGERRQLQALRVRRRQLVDMAKQEKTRLQQTANPWARRDIASHLRLLARRIGKANEAIAALIRATPALSRASQRLQSAPGVGPVVAMTLLADMPELGTLDRRQIAALAGLAPLARDSGHRRGKRSIRGGRPEPRSMLYLAALQATRHNPAFMAFRERLEARGKTHKQAIIAAARKLLTILNAMIKSGKNYNPDFA